MLNGELASVPTNDLLAELDRRHEAVVMALALKDPDEEADVVVFFSGGTFVLSALATKLFFKVGMVGLLNDPEEPGELETGEDDGIC